MRKITAIRNRVIAIRQREQGEILTGCMGETLHEVATVALCFATALLRVNRIKEEVAFIKRLRDRPRPQISEFMGLLETAQDISKEI